MRALLIDGGQSGCRAAVVDHGRTLATTALPGLPRQGRDYAVLRALLAGAGEARGGVAWSGEARGGSDVAALPPATPQLLRFTRPTRDRAPPALA